MVKSNNQLVTFYKYLMTRFYFNIRIYVQDLSLVAAAIGWLPTLISYPGGAGCGWMWCGFGACVFFRMLFWPAIGHLKENGLNLIR